MSEFLPVGSDKRHDPVLLRESIEGMNLAPGKVVIDGTLGLGGHSEVILENIGESGQLLAIDQDSDHLEFAKKRLNAKNVTYAKGNFEEMEKMTKEHGCDPCDAILLDLGVASPHLDDASRGFSFRSGGPLDMRMDPSQELTAADIINHWPEEELSRIFWEYGEEKKARILARKIVERRAEKPFTNTDDLATFIVETKYQDSSRKHPALLIFQALRIAVNRELDVLQSALEQGVRILKTGGRFVVISYHSLEDRMVKHFFREMSRECVCPMTLPKCECGGKAVAKLITRKSIIPSDEEIARNPRARSAHLRILEKM